MSSLSILPLAPPLYTHSALHRKVNQQKYHPYPRPQPSVPDMSATRSLSPPSKAKIFANNSVFESSSLIAVTLLILAGAFVVTVVRRVAKGIMTTAPLTTQLIAPLRDPSPPTTTVTAHKIAMLATISSSDNDDGNMYDESWRIPWENLYQGDKFKGVVTSRSPLGALVDIGALQSGFIPEGEIIIYQEKMEEGEGLSKELQVGDVVHVSIEMVNPDENNLRYSTGNFYNK